MANGKAILAALAGVAAGAALGLLFAPDKGSELRKKISKKGGDITDALNDKIDRKFDELLTAITGKVKRPGSKNDTSVKKDEIEV